MACHLAFAGPADYVYTPTVEQGEREIDVKFGHWNTNAAQPQTDSSIGLGYGVNAWWFTEIYMKRRKANGQLTTYDATEWENKFQLTETGRFPMDIGFLLEIERPRDHADGWEVKYGPLFQTEFGKVQLNANLLFERKYHAQISSTTELGCETACKSEQEFGGNSVQI